MKITIIDELGIHEMLQAIYEQLIELEVKYGIRYSKGLTLYINPSNGFGDEVVAYKKNGEEVKKIRCKGPYRSAADHYKI